MKPTRLTVIVFSLAAASAHAQTSRAYRGVVETAGTPVTSTALRGMPSIDMSSLIEPGEGDSASKVFGLPSKRFGLEDVASSNALGIGDLDDDARRHRAWGITVGVEGSVFGLRVAHQNKNVAKVAPAMPLGNRMDAKNSIIAATMNLGIVKVYTAYSANRGWGSSPLWNPDNPYGALMASTPSTDSRDVLMGLAVPVGATTWLATFVRKNDRDLANRDADQFAFGATYSISRRTDFYAAYSHTQFRQGAAALGGITLDSTKGSSALNIGMRHAF